MRTILAILPWSLSSVGGSTGQRYSQNMCTLVSWSSAETTD